MDVVLNQEFLGEEEEADLVEWLVADGATVAEGDVLAQFETSKLVAEFKSPAAGVVSQKAEEGDIVNLGDTFATVV